MKKLNLLIPTIVITLLFSVSCSKEEASEPTPVVTTPSTPNNPQPTNGSITAIIDGVPFTANSITASFIYTPSIPDPNGGVPTPEYTVLKIDASNSSGTTIEISQPWSFYLTNPIPANYSLIGYSTTTVRFTINSNNYFSPQSGNLNILSVDTVNRLVSGTFNVSARNPLESNYVYHDLTNGVFTNIHY